MARIILNNGEISDSVIGGSSLNEVFGTNGSEQITIRAGGKAVLDASFNRGGDTIHLLGTAGSYDVRSSGSSIILTDALGGTVTIPVGTVGATIDFADGARTLVFNTTTNQIQLGSQVVTTTATDVDGVPAGTDFNLVPETAAGADVMRLTGNQAVRIDFTKTDNQVVGLDLDGDGLVENNGSENVNPTTLDDGQRFEIVDAYARDKANEANSTANYLGNIYYDGVGFGGDGVNTDGNIFLGGLGADIALGGIGNDFLAGGGVAQGNSGHDRLDGGRNADFFFAELSLLDNVDGNGLEVHGGSTTDDSAVGNNTPQDSDWLLLEVGDDEDGTVIDLSADRPTKGVTDETLRVTTGAGQAMFGDEIENVDASGNIYGFLNDFAGTDLVLGSGGGANSNGEYQGLGSSAQLDIRGSIANNILIGGYDNDRIIGREGSDLLFGGNLNYALFNPNSVGIFNDGADELFGGDDADSLVWEADGGVYEGENELNATSGSNDTLWLTSLSLGSKTVDEITTDGVLRFDLAVGGGSGVNGGVDAAAGYGGADAATSKGYTADQTNYVAGQGRTTTQDLENVITTGLGSIDFLAAGTNDPELNFNNQQNFFAYNGDLDVRGTNAENTIYLAGGDDVIEGRQGDDLLSGGEGNDDFLFSLEIGDGIDVIHRQHDIGGNLTDGTFERDFGLGGNSTTGPSSLTIDFSAANLADANVFMNSFAVNIGGTTFEVTDTAALAGVTTVAQLAALANAAFKAIDANVSVTASGDILTITDTTPTGGREISDTPPEGYDVAITVIAPGTGTLGLPIYTAPGTDSTEDRLIFVAYEDRLDNERVDDDITIGADSLGGNAYAQDLVVSFNRDGSTVLAEAQAFRVNLTNLAVEDTVTVTVNGVDFTLTVGRALDGSLIAGETTDDFASRLADYITDYLDNDTAAGQLDAAYTASGDPDSGTFVITQVNYSGEETVFMQVSVDVDDNSSNGEGATGVIVNESTTDITLFDFDGRNGELNADNVLFVGDTGTSRSVLATAAAAGGVLLGSDAIVANVTGDKAITSSANESVSNGAIVFNTAKNPTTGEVANFAVHGDDQLFTGAGNDTVRAGTGDDRVYGSLGRDTVDGGKNLYLVDGVIRVLNTYEAAQLDANPSVIDIRLVGDLDNDGSVLDHGLNGEQNALFDDTLILQQADIGAGAVFEITLDLTSQQANGGAGKVVTNGNEVANRTLFTNFENIRTVSGNGTLAGQGNDTLDLSVSVNPLTGVETTNAFNMLYFLDNSGNSGNVYLDRNDDNSFAGSELVIAVDGVENVLFGTGDDILFIDETEAGKNNTVNGGLGADTVNYSFDINGDNVLNPGVTLTVSGAANTDYVDMAGGSLKAGDVPRDTLVSIETINFDDSLDNPTLDDTLNVSALTSGAVVDFVNGEVRTGISVVELEIGGIDGFEIVTGSAGNDTVIVADAGSIGNVRLNVGDPVDVTFDSFLNYDLTDDRGAVSSRLSIAELRAIAPGTADTADQDDIPESENVGLYRYNLGDGTSDRIDYSNETGRIAVTPNLAASSSDFNVLVLGGDEDLDDANDRVDQITGGEQIVASQGESIIDLTASGERDVVITYQATADAALVGAYDAVNGGTEANARREFTVLLEDAATTTPFNTLRFIEYADANGADDVTVPTASWNRIEGSDGDETVQFTSAQEAIEHTLNLRGGDNTVLYNLQTNGVTVSINSINAATGGVDGVTDIDIAAQDVSGALTGTVDRVTSYNSQNELSSGSLTIYGSTLFRDAIDLGSITGNSLYLLGEMEDGVSKLEVTFDTDADGSFTDSEVGLTLIGFETLIDGAGDDTYEIADLTNFFDTFVAVTDTGGDDDTLKLRNGALEASAADGVDFSDDTIELDDFEDAIDGANDGVENFDFDVLDISALTTETDSVITNDLGETVILGNVGLIGDNADALTDIDGFETVKFTTTTGMGTSVTIDLDNGEFRNAGGVLFTFNAATTFDFSALTTAVTVNVVDTGALGVTVIGSSAADTINGSQGADFFTGGAGADKMDGGFVAEVTEKVVVELAGGAATLEAGDDLEIGGLVVSDAGGDVTVTAGSDADQIGAAFATFANANLNTVATALGLNAGDVSGVTYDAVTNNLIYSFTSQAGDVATGTVTVDDTGVTTGTITGTVYEDGTDPSTQSVAYSARQESVDTFIYNSASESTAAATDIITSFSVGAVDDVIDFSALDHTHSGVTNGGSAFADYAAALAAANANFDADGSSVYVGGTADDTWVFHSSDTHAADPVVDVVIKLEGIAATGIDGNNFIF